MRQVGQPIDVGVAVVTWLAAFLVGQLLPVAIIATSGAETLDQVPIPTLFAAVVATWVAYLAGIYRRRGGRAPVTCASTPRWPPAPWT